MSEIVAFKKWFIFKNFEKEDAYAILNEAHHFDILTETEKAYQFSIHVSNRAIIAWVPKSVCLTKEDIKKEND